jgi:DNA recombination protein RmuC
MKDMARLDKRVGDLGKHFELTARDIAEIQTSARRLIKRGVAIESIPLEGRGGDALAADLAARGEDLEPQPRRELLQ